MREIKFRGKDILNGEWIKGYLFYDYNNADEYRPFITYKSEAFLGGVNEQQIDKDTIGQYTELHDKNRKEIYEGDIVKIDNDVASMFNIKSTGKVEYNNGLFLVQNGDEIGILSSLFILADTKYCLRGEVIGNIYDNPELLEKGEQS